MNLAPSRPLGAPTKAVGVVGMHRSGTSAMARCLAAAGTFFGNESDLLPPSPENVHGYFELRDFVEIDDALLSRCGMTWASALTPPGIFNEDPVTSRLSGDLLDAMLLCMGGQAVWGWKDPRTALLMPFWRKVLAEANVSPCYVICVRDPREVAESLWRRDGLAPEHAERLWSLYTLNALVETEDAPRSIVDYGRLLADPCLVVGSTLARLGLASFAPDSDTAAAVRGAVDPDLRHPPARTLQSGFVQVLVEGIYELAMTAVERPELLEDPSFRSRCRGLLDDYYGLLRFASETKSAGQLQVFPGAHGRFSSATVSTAELTVSEGFQVIDVEVAPSPEGLYRIDPIDRPGIVDFASVEFVRIESDGSRSVLKRWDVSQGTGEIELTRDAAWSSDASARLISFGVDPGLVFHGPPVTVRSGERFMFRFRMRCSPCPTEPLKELAKLREKEPSVATETLWRLAHGAQSMPRPLGRRILSFARRAWSLR